MTATQATWDIVVRPLGPLQEQDCEIAEILFLIRGAMTGLGGGNLTVKNLDVTSSFSRTMTPTTTTPRRRDTEVLKCSRTKWKGLPVSGPIKYDISNVQVGANPHPNSLRRLIVSDRLIVLIDLPHSLVEEVFTGRDLQDVRATRTDVVLEMKRSDIPSITISMRELPTPESATLVIAAVRSMLQYEDGRGAGSSSSKPPQILMEIGAKELVSDFVLSKQVEEVHSFLALCINKLRTLKEMKNAETNLADSFINDTLSTSSKLRRSRSSVGPNQQGDLIGRRRSSSVHNNVRESETLRPALIRTLTDMLDSIKSLKKVCKVLDRAVKGREAIKRLLFDAETRLVETANQYLTEHERLSLGVACVVVSPASPIKGLRVPNTWRVSSSTMANSSFSGMDTNKRGG